jgi:hypothetical protein
MVPFGLVFRKNLRRTGMNSECKSRSSANRSGNGASRFSFPHGEGLSLRMGLPRRAPAVLSWLLLAGSLAWANPARAADLPFDVGRQNLEFKTYQLNPIREIADCKVEKVFLDHREMGFFRVKLLPVLVVQGVRLEFAGTEPGGNWPDSFQSDWLPKARHGAVEWRDVDIRFQNKNAVRLHADWAQPAAAGSPVICAFKGVTLTANGTTWRTPRAELRNEAGRPRLIWPADGGEQRLDLFSGEIINTKNGSETK